MGRLDGKVAFLTGAGGGIGRAVCAAFLAEGACVAATDLDATAAAEAIRDAPSGRGLAIGCDAGDPDAVAAAVARTVATFGRLDVLCPIAGGSSLRDGPVTEAPVEEFRRVMALDLFGPFLACKFGIPHLVAAGGGSVITMASMVAVRPVAGRDCYTAAKGGVVALTRSMALEYADRGIRVNGIAPGITLTPRVRARVGTGGPRRAIEDKHLLGLLEPEDVAHMAVYLASDESRRMTGQILSIDGGAEIA